MIINRKRGKKWEHGKLFEIEIVRKRFQHLYLKIPLPKSKLSLNPNSKNAPG